MLENLDRVKETFSAVLMVSQADGERLEIQEFVGGLLKLKMVVSRKKIFWKANRFSLKSIKEILSPVFVIDPALQIVL